MLPEQRFFYTRNGLKMAYRRWGEGGRVLVCLHGFLRTGRDFDALAEALADSYTVVCPDVIGRGESDPASHPLLYHPRVYLRDLRDLLHHLRVRRADFLGTSMGGLVGMALAARPFTPIRRLILNDTAPEASREVLQAILDYARVMPLEFDDLAAAEDYYRTIYRGVGDLSTAQWRKFTRDGLKPLPDGRWRVAYDPRIVEAAPEPRQDLRLWWLYRAIRRPVLALRGADSAVVSAPVAKRLARLPRTTVVEVRGCGHAPPLVSREQIALVREFLEA